MVSICSKIKICIYSFDFSIKLNEDQAFLSKLDAFFFQSDLTHILYLVITLEFIL